MSNNNVEIKQVVKISPLVESILKMVSPTQIAKESRKTTKNVNPLTGKVHTSKDKAVLGIDNDRSITWSYPNFVHEDGERFRLIAKECDMTAAELGAAIVMDWFDKNYDEIDKVTADRLKGEMSAEDVAKKVLALQKQLAKLVAISQAPAEGGDKDDEPNDE